MDVVEKDQELCLGNPVLDQDGRLLIPQEIRDAAGLVAGDVFEIELVDGAIVLRPVVADEDPAEFWGPNWREALEESEANRAAGRSRVHESLEDFIAALDAHAHADPRRR